MLMLCVVDFTRFISSVFSIDATACFPSCAMHTVCQTGHSCDGCFSFVSNCLPVDKWAGQCCKGFKCPSPCPGTSMDGFCISGTLQWINRKGLASRQVVKGRWGWEAGRGRTGFILSRNAFQCVSGEQELPSYTPVHWIDSRRIAGEPTMQQPPLWF